LETALRRPFAPGCGGGIGEEIVADISAAFAQRGAAGAAAFGLRGVGRDADARDVAARIAGDGDRFDEAARRVEATDPGDAEAADVDQDSADVREEFVAVLGADHRLVDLADDEKNAVEPLDFLLVRFALGDVAHDREELPMSVAHDQPGADLDWELGAVFAPVGGLEHDARRLECGRKIALDERCRRGAAQIRGFQREHFLQRAAVGGQRAVVGFEDALLLVEKEDDVVGVLGEEGEALAEGPPALFRDEGAAHDMPVALAPDRVARQAHGQQEGEDHPAG
jgi:hypothetical protein